MRGQPPHLLGCDFESIKPSNMFPVMVLTAVDRKRMTVKASASPDVLQHFVCVRVTDNQRTSGRFGPRVRIRALWLAEQESACPLPT